MAPVTKKQPKSQKTKEKKISQDSTPGFAPLASKIVTDGNQEFIQPSNLTIEQQAIYASQVIIPLTLKK